MKTFSHVLRAGIAGFFLIVACGVTAAPPTEPRDTEESVADLVVQYVRKAITKNMPKVQPVPTRFENQQIYDYLRDLKVKPAYRALFDEYISKKLVRPSDDLERKLSRLLLVESIQAMHDGNEPWEEKRKELLAIVQTGKGRVQQTAALLLEVERNVAPERIRGFVDTLGKPALRHRQEFPWSVFYGYVK